MIWVVYGIGVTISYVIAVALCYKADEDNGEVTADEFSMAGILPLFWPILLPLAVIWGLGLLVYIAFLEKR